jgi:hypothetical protein
MSGLSQGEQAEFLATIDRWKHSLAVLEIVQADETAGEREGVEIRLGAVVGGDAGGHDESRAVGQISRA